jgi:hypothetical protein
MMKNFACAISCVLAVVCTTSVAPAQSGKSCRSVLEATVTKSFKKIVFNPSSTLASYGMDDLVRSKINIALEDELDTEVDTKVTEGTLGSIVAALQKTGKCR